MLVSQRQNDGSKHIFTVIVLVIPLCYLYNTAAASAQGLCHRRRGIKLNKSSLFVRRNFGEVGP